MPVAKYPKKYGVVVKKTTDKSNIWYKIKFEDGTDITLSHKARLGYGSSANINKGTRVKVYFKYTCQHYHFRLVGSNTKFGKNAR